MRGAEGAGRGRDGASRVAWEERCCGTRCGGVSEGASAHQLGSRRRPPCSGHGSRSRQSSQVKFASYEIEKYLVGLRAGFRFPLGCFSGISQKIVSAFLASRARLRRLRKARKSPCPPRCRTSRSSRSGRSSSRATSPMSRSRSSRAGAGRAVSTRAIAAGTCCRRRSNHVCASAAGQASGRAGQGRAPGFASRDAWQRTELSAAEGLTIGPRRLALGGR